MARTIVSREPNWSGLGSGNSAATEGETTADMGRTPWRPVENLRPPTQLPPGVAQPLGQEGRNFPTLPNRATAVAQDRISQLRENRQPTPTGAPAPVGLQPSAQPSGATPNAMPAAMGTVPTMRPTPEQRPTAPVANPSIDRPAAPNGLINQVGGRN